MKSLALLLALGFAQSSFKESSTPEKHIRETVDRDFTLASTAQRAVYTQRLLAKLERLPSDPVLRKQGLRHIGDITSGAESAIGMWDGYRKAAETRPELRPVVLPDRFYFSAYELTLERLDATFARVANEPRVPDSRVAAVRSQLDAIHARLEALVERRLGKNGSDLAKRRASEIMKGLNAVVDHPFWGYERALEPAELDRVMAQLSERIGKLPFIMLDESRLIEKDFAETLSEEQRNSLSGEEFERLARQFELEQRKAPVVFDPKVAAALVREAVQTLYQYSEAASPVDFQNTRALWDLEKEALAWCRKAKADHPELTSRIPSRRSPLVSSRLGTREPELKAPPEGSVPSPIGPRIGTTGKGKGHRRRRRALASADSSRVLGPVRARCPWWRVLVS